MNISNINLKCDGTLPKGKFLECTEHTNIFSYCSKCDMLLCSNCIINHFFDNKELHSSEDDIMPINIYFNNFGETYKKFLNSLDSFESMIETKPMDAVLKALYDNMGILKGIQAKLNKILEHYNNLIKWYEKENKPLLDKTDFIKTKGKLSLMFHAYNIGNYDTKTILKWFNEIQNKLEEYNNNMKVSKHNNPISKLDVTAELYVQTNIIKPNLSDVMKYMIKLDGTITNVEHIVDNNSIMNLQKGEIKSNLNVSHPYKAENLIYIDTNNDTKNVIIYNSKHNHLFKATLLSALYKNKDFPLNKIKIFHYINLIDSALITAFHHNRTQFPHILVFHLSINKEIIDKAFIDKSDLSIINPISFSFLQGINAEINNCLMVFIPKLNQVLTVGFGKPNTVYSAILDMDNKYLGWKPIAKPKLKTPQFNLFLFNQRYVYLLKDKTIYYEVLDINQIDQGWEKKSIKPSLVKLRGMGIIYTNEDTITLLGWQKSYRLLFDKEGKSITEIKEENNNYRYLHFSSSMFYLCGDELVNWSGGCFPEQLIVYDPLTNKIKTDYKNIKTTIFKINI